MVRKSLAEIIKCQGRVEGVEPDLRVRPYKIGRMSLVEKIYWRMKFDFEKMLIFHVLSRVQGVDGSDLIRYLSLGCNLY